MEGCIRCCQEPMLLVWSNPSSWTTLNLVVRNVGSMTQSLVFLMWSNPSSWTTLNLVVRNVESMT